jgi:hypothetical protein
VKVGDSNNCSSLRIVGVKVIIAEAKETFFAFGRGKGAKQKTSWKDFTLSLHFDKKN